MVKRVKTVIPGIVVTNTKGKNKIKKKITRRKLRRTPNQSNSVRTVSRPKYGRSMLPSLRNSMAAESKRMLNNGFLKCAFAPFDGLGHFQGIPDDYCGNILPMDLEHTELITIPAGGTYYIWMIPSVGAAFYSSDRLVGTSTSVNNVYPHFYPTFVQQLVQDQTGVSPPKILFSQFRLASSSVQITNYTPMINKGGSVRAVKFQQALEQDPVSASTPAGLLSYYFTGNPTTLSQGAYTDALEEGATVRLSNVDSKFLIRPAISQVTDSGIEFPMENWCNLSNGAVVGSVSDAMLGFDPSFQSVIIEIIAPAAYAQNISLKCTQCVEIIPDAGTIFASMARPSPAHDPIVMAYYNAISKQIPFAMRRSENGNFWDTIKRIIHTISGVVSVIPINPAIQQIAAGVNALTV